MFLLSLSLYVRVSVCQYACARAHITESFIFTLWVLGLELRTPGLAGSTFTCCAISQTLNQSESCSRTLVLPLLNAVTL